MPESPGIQPPSGIKRQTYSAASRKDLISITIGVPGHTFRKRSRILAMQISEPFRVETEHGWMDGNTGDYLVTNHPDDDPTSDVWPVSKARFEATYQEVEPTDG